MAREEVPWLLQLYLLTTTALPPYLANCICQLYISNFPSSFSSTVPLASFIPDHIGLDKRTSNSIPTSETMFIFNTRAINGTVRLTTLAILFALVFPLAISTPVYVPVESIIIQSTNGRFSSSTITPASRRSGSEYGPYDPEKCPPFSADPRYFVHFKHPPSNLILAVATPWTITYPRLLRHRLEAEGFLTLGNPQFQCYWPTFVSVSANGVGRGALKYHTTPPPGYGLTSDDMEQPSRDSTDRVVRILETTFPTLEITLLIVVCSSLAWAPLLWVLYGRLGQRMQARKENRDRTGIFMRGFVPNEEVEMRLEREMVTANRRAHAVPGDF